MFEENWVREITWSSWRLCFRRRRAGLQGWRSGQSARLPPMWPGFDSRTRRHVWVESVFTNAPFSKMFFVHTKTKSWLFKFLWFDERIRKAPFSWRISVDGRPILRNKAAFSNSSGVAWKKGTLSVTFRVRIQCYILLLVTIIAYCSDRKWKVNWLL